MRKLVLCSLMASILAIGATGERFAAEAQGKVTLVANIIKNQDDYATKAFQMFAERVSERTAGSVTVDVHFGGELGYKAADGLRILQNRSVDISETIGAFEGATVPDIMITTLPFFITSFDEFAFFDSLFRGRLDELFAERNAKCLLSYSLTAQHFWNKKEVDTLADVSGVKMRTYDKNTTDMLDAVGAAPLRIDFTELYTALQQGTVDGMVTSIASVISLKAWEVVTLREPHRLLDGRPQLPGHQHRGMVRAFRRSESRRSGGGPRRGALASDARPRDRAHRAGHAPRERHDRQRGSRGDRP